MNKRNKPAKPGSVPGFAKDAGKIIAAADKAAAALHVRIHKISISNDVNGNMPTGHSHSRMGDTFFCIDTDKSELNEDLLKLMLSYYQLSHGQIL
jgi:hypothetical protein